MKTLLKNCRFIITQNSKREVLENQDILIEGNQIKKISKNISAKFDIANRERIATKAREELVIDASQRIVMPGLINLHTHTGMQSLRGFADDMNLKDWLEKKIWAEEKKLTAKKVYDSTKSACTEMIKTGTTCFNDMYFFMGNAAKAAEEYGIRAFLSYGVIDLGNSKKAKKEIQATEKFKKFLEKQNNLQINFALGPHSAYTCSKETLIKLKDIADKNKALLHIHLAETKDDKRTKYLDEIGFLGKNVIAAHCCWLSDSDIKTLAKNNVSIAHCPSSNMKLASGVMPFEKLKKAKVNVGLGTDSAVSNNNLDMFEEMKFAALLQKINDMKAESAAAQDVLDMATINGAKALGLNAGSIEVGKLADIILLDVNDILIQPAEKNRIISNIVYSANGYCVREVLVDGKIIWGI